MNRVTFPLKCFVIYGIILHLHCTVLNYHPIYVWMVPFHLYQFINFTMNFIIFDCYYYSENPLLSTGSQWYLMFKYGWMQMKISVCVWLPWRMLRLHVAWGSSHCCTGIFSEYKVCLDVCEDCDSLLYVPSVLCSSLVG